MDGVITAIYLHTHFELFSKLIFDSKTEETNVFSYQLSLYTVHGKLAKDDRFNLAAFMIICEVDTDVDVDLVNRTFEGSNP